MKTITQSKCTNTLSIIGLACVMLVGAISRASAQTDQDLIEVARRALKTDRQAVVVEAMQLTDEESKNFWPLHREYRIAMYKVND